MTPEDKKEAERLADDVMKIVQRVAGRRLFQAIGFLYEEEIEPIRKENEALRYLLSTIHVNLSHAVKKNGKDDIFYAILDYSTQELRKLGLVKSAD